MSSTTVNKGDLVLITGATGWVGSHIAERALARGLRIRLAYRDEEKARKLVKDLSALHDNDDKAIELVKVDSFEQADAYKEAVRGVQGVVHAASVVAFGSWDDVVPPTLRGVEAILEAAAGERSIKRFVLTSSSCALGMPNIAPASHSPPQRFTTQTWNEASVQRGQTKEAQGGDAYAASKTLGEQRAFAFVKERKPSFILNAVLPNMCSGQAVPGQPYLSTGRWWREVVLHANEDFLRIPSQYCVDVDDVAELHVVALMQTGVENERILAFAERFTWDQIIDLGKKYVAEARLPDKSAETGLEDNTVVDLARTKELLAPYGGLKGLEESFKRNLEVAP